LKIIMKNGGILKRIFRWASMLWILYEFNDNRINLLKLFFKVPIFYGFLIRNFQIQIYPKLVFPLNIIKVVFLFIHFIKLVFLALIFFTD
jgi:hypothetical protein